MYDKQIKYIWVYDNLNHILTVNIYLKFYKKRFWHMVSNVFFVLKEVLVYPRHHIDLLHDNCCDNDKRLQDIKILSQMYQFAQFDLEPYKENRIVHSCHNYTRFRPYLDMDWYVWFWLYLKILREYLGIFFNNENAPLYIIVSLNHIHYIKSNSPTRIGCKNKSKIKRWWIVTTAL